MIWWLYVDSKILGGGREEASLKRTLSKETSAVQTKLSQRLHRNALRLKHSLSCPQLPTFDASLLLSIAEIFGVALM